MYEGMDTNADALQLDQGLTRRQIDALAKLEDVYVGGRGTGTQYLADQVEVTLHEFMCEAMGECVCANMRPVTQRQRTHRPRLES